MKCKCTMVFIGRRRKARDANRNGLSRLDEYKIWQGVRERCKRHRQLKYYSGKVRISSTWKESFYTFEKDMGKRPTKMHSIDRIDNGGGYCKHNCRWATKFEQVINRRGLPIGISRRPAGTFAASIIIFDRKIHLGTFLTKREAESIYAKFSKLKYRFKKPPSTRGNNGKTCF